MAMARPIPREAPVMSAFFFMCMMYYNYYIFNRFLCFLDRNDGTQCTYWRY